MLPQITLPKINTGSFAFSGDFVTLKPDVTFATFVDLVTKGKYQWYDHCVKLANVLQRVATGEIKRLMVFMPPRHGKSELISRLFSAYFLHTFPEKYVGVNSYAAELAYTFSRSSRENFIFAGGDIAETAYAVKHWETKQGGGLWAAGVGGPITGKGYDLGIIDDPIKNAEDAASETIRKKQKEWYDSTFYTREEPDAAIIVIQTRWHEDDLSGYILSKENEAPEHWHIVDFEAIKSETSPKYPETCTLEFDDRTPGEALAPKRYTVNKLQQIKKRIGSYFWNALYQQKPQPPEGNLFKREWFTLVDVVPSQCRRVRYWDKAGTMGDGAYTCGVLIAFDPVAKVYYVEDLVRGQWSAFERETIIRQTAQMDRQKYGPVETYIEQEPGSGGKESAENTIKNLAGFVVIADRPTGDKTTRARPLAAQSEAANVRIANADWTPGYMERLTAFPYGTYRDDVDATSGAFNKLTDSNTVMMATNPLTGYRG